jgi:uncharacterized protein YceH (UPF0502 family)
MITLSANQCRVIGVMLEKETTTPEQYPLSLNSITLGCNQKSNREPVTSFAESDVQNLVDELVEMNMLMLDHKASARVNKYFHRFCDTEFGHLRFTPQQKSIICVLLLRGPQTPGELRTRTNRLAEFTDVSEIEKALQQLQDFGNETLIKKLEREPGKREARYVHLFSDTSEIDLMTVNTLQTDVFPPDSKSSLAQRVVTLEKQVAMLSKQVSHLTDLLENK